MTQKTNLVSYLKRNDAVTPMIARKEMGIESLSSVVSALRKRGFSIIKTWKKSFDGKRYASYSLAT